jgi:carboxypeptidase Taq
MMRNLDILTHDLRLLAQLRGVAAMLSWDQETYMPSEGAAARADQISLVLSMAHARFTGLEFRKSLGQLVDLPTGKVLEDGLAPEEVRLLQLTWRDWQRATALPVEFVGELAHLTSESEQVWQKARHDNDYSIFAPYLRKIINLKRQEADYLGYEETPYDALIENYEPGMTTTQLHTIFKTLRPVLVDLVKRIEKANPPDRREILNREYPEALQWEFGVTILRDMGYDMTRGRQDLAAHPFTTDFHYDP